MSTHAKAQFAAGCFWGVEAHFRQVPGVTETAVGYAGGHQDAPTYELVCSGSTGHAETVEVTFDPDRVNYADLLSVFWRIHDPTQGNRQGPDIGTQYRSAIYFLDDSQREFAEASLAAESESGRHPRPITTEIAAAGKFWRAEDYHQQYFEKRGVPVHAHA